MGDQTNSNNILPVIACILIISLLLLLIILIIINKKNKTIVLEKSIRLKNLLDLNKTTKFITIKPYFSFHQSCNSKRQLDNLSIDDYLITLIDSDENFFQNLIDSISLNRSTYESYMSSVNTLQTTATEEYCQTFNFSLKKFLKYENRLFKKIILRKPIQDITVYCKATYTSPKGRNHYWKDKSYNYNTIKNFFDYTLKLKVQRQTRQYQIKVERAKMTDSLRYDILKRDNFKCQICGSSAQDGVKLHVDHIIPVAKGGQTIHENLRTLCDRCNMGKSDKL